MADLINKKDSLNDGRKKLNKAIKDADEAKLTADQALLNSENTQQQLDTVVIEGDSSVEAAQARVNADNSKTYDTLKHRLDEEYEETHQKIDENYNNVIMDLVELETKSLGTVNITSYEVFKNGDDWTPAWEQLVSETPEGFTIKFPTGEYLGNFITNKSYHLDFQGSTVTPYHDQLPAIKFEGDRDSTHSVVGTVKYGDLSFDVINSDGLNVGDVGYLVDEKQRPSDNTPEINTELVKIKRINGNHVEVYDMIRSDQDIGNVKFTKVNTLKNPSVENVKIVNSNTNNFSSLYFFGCENVLTRNIEVHNSVGHALRHEYVYNWRSDTIRILSPRLVGSGQGYGLTSYKSRNGYLTNIYGYGTRHLVDFITSYNLVLDGAIEEDSKSSVISLSHNGYGGNIKVSNITCVADNYAVGWSRQGVDDLDKTTIRDVEIKNVNHTIPTTPVNTYFVSVYLQLNCERVFIENINVHVVNDSATPSSSIGVRINGNIIDVVSVKNITVNSIGSAVYVTPISYRSYMNSSLIIDGVFVGRTENAVRIRGIMKSSVDNVRVEREGDVMFLEAYQQMTPNKLVLGGNVSTRIGKIFKSSGVINLAGDYPRLSEGTASALILESGDKIPFDRIVDSGTFLRIATEVNKDTTLNNTTPLDPPIWSGQELTIAINALGGGGARGDLIIPSGSQTYADSGSDVILKDGNVYKLVGYGGKWKVVS